MIPTLNGRYQTRLFLIVFVAVPWTFVITPFLPHRGGGSFTDVAKHLYPVTFAALAVVLILGWVLWEWVWYLLQLCRWEKDWPSMFFLLQVIPEGTLAYVVLRALGIPQHHTSGVATEYATFIVHILTTWIVIFLFVEGPIKVLFIRWRFRGGRIFW
jgi:hypothetical protein